MLVKAGTSHKLVGTTESNVYQLRFKLVSFAGKRLNRIFLEVEFTVCSFSSLRCQVTFHGKPAACHATQWYKRHTVKRELGELEFYFRKIPLHQQKSLVVSGLSNSPWLLRNLKNGSK